MRWLLIGLFFISESTADAELYGFMIGVPTKTCAAKREIEDNGCRISDVLSKERIIKKAKK